MKKLVLATCAASIIGIAVAAQAPAPQQVAAGDWPMYSRDPGGTRFSPLTDITPANVSRLAQAWSVQLTQPAGRRGGGPGAAGRGAGRGAAPDAGQGAGRGAAPAAGA